MTTLDRPRTEPEVQKGSQVNKWLVGAVVLFVLLTAMFFILWMVETSESADLEASATAMETELAETASALTASRADLAASDASLAAARAELTNLSAVHPDQEGVDALFGAFTKAILDPNAEDIAALFTPNGTNTTAWGETTSGAQEIGEGYVEYGGFTATLDDHAVLIGDGPRFAAAIPGNAVGTDGFIVAIVQKWNDRYVFHNLVWHEA